jgi:hypothetical protein
VLWLFHGFLKYPLLSLLPEAHRKRLMPVAREFRFGPLPHFGIIVISIVMGALTHLVWDAITHEGVWSGWGAQYLSFLRRPIWQSGAPDPLKLYDVLQHASTVLGAAFLVFWYLRWVRQKPVTDFKKTTARASANSRIGIATQGDTPRLAAHLSDKARKQLLLAFIVITPVFSVAFNYNTKALLDSYASFQAFLRLTVLLSVPLLLLQLCVYSVIWHLVASRQFTSSEKVTSRAATNPETSSAQMDVGRREDGESTTEHTEKSQRVSGEYSLRFAGNVERTAATKSRSTET